MNNFYIKNLFTLFLLLFTFLYIKYEVRPNLRGLISYEKNVISLSNDSKAYQKNLISPDNRFSFGKSFLFREDGFWYKIIQLSFWREEYLNLSIVDRQLDIKKEEIKTIKNNNFALGNLKKEKVVYSCMKEPNTFYYDVNYKKIPKANDLNHWWTVFIKNLKDVVYSYKARNYECLLIITTNTKFFENSEKKINETIYKKFIYD